MPIVRKITSENRQYQKSWKIKDGTGTTAKHKEKKLSYNLIPDEVESPSLSEGALNKAKKKNVRIFRMLKYIIHNDDITILII